MADRELRVLILGDSSSLQHASTTAESSISKMETRLKNLAVVGGEAGGMSDGLARKMSALNQLGFTPATLGLVGVTIGIGLAVEAGKKLIDIHEKELQATNDLNGAIEDNGYKRQQVTDILERFLTTNKHAIADNAEVTQGYAEMLRAGVPVAHLQRDLNASLDVSIAKNKPLAQVMEAVTAAELGRTRGLADMGVNVKAINEAAAEQVKDTTAYNTALREQETAHKGVVKAQNELADAIERVNTAHKRTPAMLESVEKAQGKVTTATAAAVAADKKVIDTHAELGPTLDKIALALDELAHKYHGAAQKATPLRVAQDDLNHTWERASEHFAPALETVLGGVLGLLNNNVNSVLDLESGIEHVLSYLGKVAGTGHHDNTVNPYAPTPQNHGKPIYNLGLTPGMNGGGTASDVTSRAGNSFVANIYTNANGDVNTAATIANHLSRVFSN